MSYTITHQCIGCDRCLSACPTKAIHRKSDGYWIDPEVCTSCRGYYRVPQCWAVCPTNKGCVPLMTGISAVETTLSQSESIDYWERWFTNYQQAMTHLKTTKQSTYREHLFA